MCMYEFMSVYMYVCVYVSVYLCAHMFLFINLCKGQLMFYTLRVSTFLDSEDILAGFTSSKGCLRVIMWF